MSHNVLKRKTLKQGSGACFRAGVPDCRGRAGLVKGFLLRLQDIPGLGGGGLQVRLEGKGGKRSFTALCFSLQMAWSCQPQSGFQNQWYRIERGDVLSLSHVQLFVTPWTASPQTLLSMEFPKQEYWSGLPFPSPGALPDPGSEPVHAQLLQSCLTLCDPKDCSLPGSSVHEILQARILEWVAIPFFRGSTWPRDRTWVSCIAGSLNWLSHQVDYKYALFCTEE